MPSLETYLKDPGAAFLTETLPRILKFGWKLLPAAWLRFISVILFAYCGQRMVFGFHTYTAADFTLNNLRRVLLVHHLTASLGLDEQILCSFIAERPFAMRLVTPGSPVTPLFPFLPKRQSMLGILSYISFLFFSCWVLYSSILETNQIVQISILFGIACTFDVGIFYATRPGDIFKFLVATAFLSKGMMACYVMCALLYFWSGVAKLRSYFCIWIYHYQFLAFSPVSIFLLPACLTKDLVPKRISMLFGFGGAFGEMVVGVLMLIPQAEFMAVCLATSMHAFITIFGVGPYRWNLVQVYLIWSSLLLKQCSPFDGKPIEPMLLLLVLLTGIGAPILGLISPEILGKYFGGYRMASFHFAGNERCGGFFLRRSVVKSAVATQNGTSRDLSVLLGKLLLESDCLVNSHEFWTFALYADGFNILMAAEDVAKISSAQDINEFDKEFMFVCTSTLNYQGLLLNTKWDESLVSITARYEEIVKVIVKPFANKGDVLRLNVFSLPHIFAPSRTWQAFDMFASDNTLVKGIDECSWSKVPTLSKSKRN